MKPLVILVIASCAAALFAQESVPASRRGGPSPFARISGRVVDDRTSRPVVAFDLALGPTSHDLMSAKEGRQRFRDPEGRFEYRGAQPGRLWLLASAADYGGGRSCELIITPGIGLEGLEIRMVRGAMLTGRVVDAGGTSIAGAVVTIDVPRPPPSMFITGPRRLIECEHPETTTTDTGTYSFPHLLGGTYVLVVKHPDRAPYSSEPFNVATSGNQTMPDIILARGAAIRGRVKLRDGSSDPHAMVQIVPVGTTPNFSGHRSAYTDSDGRFEVNGLALGQYRVVVVQRNGQPDLAAIFTNLKNPAVFTLGEGEVKELDL